MAELFSVTAPDGSEFQVERPPGMSDEQFTSEVDSAFAQEFGGFAMAEEEAAAGVQSRGVIPREPVGDPQTASPFPTGRPIPSDFTPSDVLEKAGLGTQEAPPLARMKINLGLGNIDGIQNVLSAEFNKPVEVKKDDIFGMVFRVQGEEKFRPVNRDDLSGGDFAAAFPEFAQTSLEVLAALGGAGAAGGLSGGPGAIPGALTAETVASYGTELGRLMMGTSDFGGNQPISDAEMHRAARIRAGITAVSGPVGNILQGIFRRVTGRALPPDIERVEMALDQSSKDSIATARGVENDFNDLLTGTGEKGTFSLGEASGNRAILAGEEASTREAIGQPVRVLEEKNDAAVKTALDRAFPGRVTDATEDQFAGEAVNRQARVRLDAEASDVERVKQSAIERAEDAKKAAFGDLPGAEEAAQEARNLMLSARTRLEAPLKQEREAIISEAGELPIQLNQTRIEGLKLTRQLKKSNFPSLQQEVRQAIDEAREAGITLQSVFRPGADGKYTNIKKTPATLEEALNDISNLNDAIRRSDVTPKQKRVLVTLNKALRRDLNASLSKLNPEIHARVLKNNMEFAVLKNQWERGIIGEILRQKPLKEGGGGFFVKNRAVVPRLVNSTTDAGEVVSILSRSGNSGPRALGVLRQGVLDHLEENPNSWVKRKANYERLLTPEQFKMVREARNATEGVKAVRAQESETLRLLNKVSDAKLADLDAPNLVGELFRPGRFQDFKRARNLLRKRDPARLAEFDGAVKRFVLDTVSPDGKVPTPQSIDKILKPAQGQNIQNHLTEVFGSDYLRHLRVIRNFQSRRRGVMFGEASVKPINDLARIFTMGAPGLTGYFRFLRVAAPPLSVRGRALTAVTGLGKEGAQRQLINAFVDPTKIKALADMGRSRVGSKLMAQQLAIIGAHNFEDLRQLYQRILPGALENRKSEE